MTMSLQVGSRYEDYHSLENAIKEYEKEHNVTFWKREARTIRAMSSILTRVNPENSENLKYYRIKYTCIFGGRRLKKRTTGTKPRRSTTFRQDCPAHFSVLLTTDQKFLQVVAVNADHNHVISEELNNALPRQRREVRKKLQLQTQDIAAKNKGEGQSFNKEDHSTYQGTNPSFSQSEESFHQPTQSGKRKRKKVGDETFALLKKIANKHRVPSDREKEVYSVLNNASFSQSEEIGREASFHQPTQSGGKKTEDITIVQLEKKGMKQGVSKDREEEVYAILKNVCKRDEFTTYGEHVGNEIRQLSSRSQIMVKHLINNILFEAASGKFDCEFVSVPVASYETCVTDYQT